MGFSAREVFQPFFYWDSDGRLDLWILETGKSTQGEWLMVSWFSHGLRIVYIIYSIYIYVCMYVCTYDIYIYVYICIHMIYIYVYIYTYDIYIYMYIHTCMNV